MMIVMMNRARQMSSRASKDVVSPRFPSGIRLTRNAVEGGATAHSFRDALA